MSTKKDKFSTKDNIYMEIALKLAKSRYGHTGSNPSVGRESTTDVSPFFAQGQIINYKFLYIGNDEVKEITSFFTFFSKSPFLTLIFFDLKILKLLFFTLISTSGTE